MPTHTRPPAVLRCRVRTHAYTPTYPFVARTLARSYSHFSFPFPLLNYESPVHSDWARRERRTQNVAHAAIAVSVITMDSGELTPPGHGYEHSPDMKSNRLRSASAAEAMRKRERRPTGGRGARPPGRCRPLERGGPCSRGRCLSGRAGRAGGGKQGRGGKDRCHAACCAERAAIC